MDDQLPSLWHCPVCGYDLHSLAQGPRVRCPECGRMWSTQWLLDGAQRPLPSRRWVLMPLTGLVITTFAGAAAPMSGAWGLVWFVVFVWTAACWIIAASRSARPRLGDMAGVIAAFLVLVPAGTWAAICTAWGRILANLVHGL